ncbi:class I adenylate-forming enzyme family protein [Heyndrickxia acidicola]|uniref:AMP-binding protein n=1 Tax=Heyndrickxia acidicola TaxID=209389 RepID=A0ABU6MHP7_9BACI|nr:AMP-binding protein [Heyndrickxia acidicola]MED1204035.1 AMP-binding protein [Heyndrickxia acidicola]
MPLLQDLLDDNIQTYGEYPFLYFGEKEYSNIETKRHAGQIAAGLKNLGIQEGDRVIVCMPNCPEVLFSYQGITRARAVIVPVMHLLHHHEIEFIIKNSNAKAIITSSASLQKIKEATNGLVHKPSVISTDSLEDASVIQMKDWFNEKENEETNSLLKASVNEPAVILYTSGTTGKPKGVILTHQNLYSNAASSASVNKESLKTTLGVLPLAHVFGLTVSNICYLKGSSIVIFSKFDVEEVFSAIEKYKVRTFSVVPAMVYAMYHYPHADRYDLSSLDKLTSGSAPLPLALSVKFKKKFQADVTEGYGLSEAAPIVTSSYDGIPHKPGSAGLPIPGVDIKIVDIEGNELAPNEVGELIVQGENVTPGYFLNEEETNKVLKGGWLYTGDLAKVDDDGYVYLVDRKKDLIIRGGFNIYPRDIEELIVNHPSVLEAAVIGVPDERMGEEVVAFIVRKPGAEVSEEEMIQHCQSFLAKNKSPKEVVFVDALPRNGVGKILKTVLREMAVNR